MMLWYIVFGLVLFPISFASNGDSSNEYRGCYHVCHFNNCSSSRHILKFETHQSYLERLFLWTCDDECKYLCMWHVTDIFTEKGLRVPQFFGKWPFVRFFGLQEPASVLFSLCNLFAHGINLIKLRKSLPSNAPLYNMWILYSLVCINAWIWSTVFHCRDFSFTERMDYFCAFSMVLFSLFSLFVRLCGPLNALRKYCIGIVCLLLFIHHVWYLSAQVFDYGYNMKINVTVGLVSCCGWLWWAIPRRGGRPYVQWCVLTIIGALASLVFELSDFPPYLWTIDAHALWHLCTAFLPFTWYRFVIEDSLYMFNNPSKGHNYRKNV